MPYRSVLRYMDNDITVRTIAQAAAVVSNPHIHRHQRDREHDAPKKHAPCFRNSSSQLVKKTKS